MMNEIRKIALIGAGAVGCYFIDRLNETEHVELTVIAGGARKERLERDGLKVNGRIIKPVVCTASEAGVQDLILIATKYMALDETIDLLPEMMGEDTIVLSLLNGVDSEERIAAAMGWEHVLHSVMRIASERRDGEVNYKINGSLGVSFNTVNIAEHTNAPACDAVLRLTELFEKAGIYYHVPEDILEDMWSKYAANIANNLPQAVLGLPARFYKTEDGLYLARTLWSEVHAVAASRGVKIEEEAVIWNFPDARYSTLQDLDAGRKTEIDMFTGTLIRMAEESGIKVPCAETIHHLIKAREVQNEGFYE